MQISTSLLDRLTFRLFLIIYNSKVFYKDDFKINMFNVKCRAAGSLPSYEKLDNSLQVCSMLFITIRLCKKGPIYQYFNNQYQSILYDLNTSLE